MARMVCTGTVCVVHIPHSGIFSASLLRRMGCHMYGSAVSASASCCPPARHPCEPACHLLCVDTSRLFLYFPTISMAARSCLSARRCRICQFCVFLFICWFSRRCSGIACVITACLPAASTYTAKPFSFRAGVLWCTDRRRSGVLLRTGQHAL